MITDQLWLKQLNYPQSLVWIVKPRNAELRNWSMNKNSVYGFSLRLNAKKIQEMIRENKDLNTRTARHTESLDHNGISEFIWYMKKRSKKSASQTKPSKVSEWVSKAITGNNNDYLAGAECKTTFEPKLLAGLSVVFFWFYCRRRCCYCRCSGCCYFFFFIFGFWTKRSIESFRWARAFFIDNKNCMQICGCACVSWVKLIILNYNIYIFCVWRTPR